MLGRILILEGDHEHRQRLVDDVRRTSNADAVVVVNGAELISRVQYGIYDAVFADADLMIDDLPSLVSAVRSAIARPMLILASSEPHRDLDGDLVTLIVRKPYDVAMVTGILLSAILGVRNQDEVAGSSGVAGAAADDDVVR